MRADILVGTKNEACLPGCQTQRLYIVPRGASFLNLAVDVGAVCGTPDWQEMRLPIPGSAASPPRSVAHRSRSADPKEINNINYLFTEQFYSRMRYAENRKSFYAFFISNSSFF